MIHLPLKNNIYLVFKEDSYRPDYTKSLSTLTKKKRIINLQKYHRVKSVQIQSFFWSVFSPIRTEYGPGKTPFFDTFVAV